MEKKILFEANNLSKSFGGTLALDDVSIKVYEGEIVGIIGENGAGKSTLLKIIQGVQPPSSGSMMLRGREYAPRNPRESSEAGAGMVFQEQSLINNLTVGQNIFFSREKEFAKFGFVQWKKVYRQTEAVLKSLRLDYIKPNIKVLELDYADRQMVEIAKVINNSKQHALEKSLILLDEPTSVLNEEESEHLFEEMKKIKKEGNSIVFISHRLNEVLAVSDRIYVMKNGRNSGEMLNVNIDQSVLYEAMVGKETSHEYYHLDRQTPPDDEVVLNVEDLGLFGRFKGVSFDLHKGEVLALCGVVGSGNEEVCACLCGVKKPTSGKMKLFGKSVVMQNPSVSLKKGVISVPKWRNEEGVIGMMSIYDNVSLSNLDNVKSGMIISQKKQIKYAKGWADKLRIKCFDVKDEVQRLSGGNMQKVVFSRVLGSGAKILILNHPTRGVDIGAKGDIYSLIRDVTEQGISVILLGDTLEECIGLASNIIVMKDGYVTQKFSAVPDKKPEQAQIIRYMV